MFCFDVETLSPDQDAIVLSAAILWFDEQKKYSYNELLEKVCYVKFDAKEQKEIYDRKADKETLKWWNSQCDIVKKVSLIPSKEDLSLEAGMNIIKRYINQYKKSKTETVWTRGSLDQFVIDSVCKSSLKTELLFNYAQYMDMRTAINLLKDTASRGYCTIENFDKNIVYKHDPRHDVAYDVFMLLEGK